MDINILSFLDSNKYLILAFIPFLWRIWVPIWSTFFILFVWSLASSYSDLFLLFIIWLLSTIIWDILAYIIWRRFFYINFIQKQLKKEKIEKLFKKTETFFNKRWKISIFISRFLVTRPGPYLNYILWLQSFNFKIFIKIIIFWEMIYITELLLLWYIFKDTFDYISSIFYYLWIIILIIFILLNLLKYIHKKKQ